MKSMRAVAVLALLVAGCARPTAPGPAPLIRAAPIAEETGWRGIASTEDAGRIERLQPAWAEGLAAARKAGFSKQIAEEGPLLDPAAGLLHPAPAPGSYMCRLIRFGGKEAYAAFKPFFCYVGGDEELLTITKQTGSQRPAGRLWSDKDARRLVFLGSVALGNEENPLPYGEDKSRDRVGVMQRVGNLRYRLALPWPAAGSKLEVFEMVPAPTQL